MNKAEALRRYDHLTDRALKVPRSCNPGPDWDRFLDDLPGKVTVAELVQFGEDTKNLTWPESFGETPWELASGVSYVLRHLEGPPEEPRTDDFSLRGALSLLFAHRL